MGRIEDRAWCTQYCVNHIIFSLPQLGDNIGELPNGLVSYIRIYVKIPQ